MSWAFVADSIHSRIRDTDIFFFFPIRLIYLKTN